MRIIFARLLEPTLNTINRQFELRLMSVWYDDKSINASSVQGQQLMDLENKLKVAKDELEKAALDKVRHDPNRFIIPVQL